MDRMSIDSQFWSLFDDESLGFNSLVAEGFASPAFDGPNEKSEPETSSNPVEKDTPGVRVSDATGPEHGSAIVYKGKAVDKAAGETSSPSRPDGGMLEEQLLADIPDIGDLSSYLGTWEENFGTILGGVDQICVQGDGGPNLSYDPYAEALPEDPTRQVLDPTAALTEPHDKKTGQTKQSVQIAGHGLDIATIPSVGEASCRNETAQAVVGTSSANAKHERRSAATSQRTVKQSTIDSSFKLHEQTSPSSSHPSKKRRISTGDNSWIAAPTMSTEVQIHSSAIQSGPPRTYAHPTNLVNTRENNLNVGLRGGLSEAPSTARPPAEQYFESLRREQRRDGLEMLQSPRQTPRRWRFYPNAVHHQEQAREQFNSIFGHHQHQQKQIFLAYMMAHMGTGNKTFNEYVQTAFQLWRDHMVKRNDQFRKAYPDIKFEPVDAENMVMTIQSTLGAILAGTTNLDQSIGMRTEDVAASFQIETWRWTAEVLGEMTRCFDSWRMRKVAQTGIRERVIDGRIYDLMHLVNY